MSKKRSSPVPEITPEISDPAPTASPLGAPHQISLDLIDPDSPNIRVGKAPSEADVASLAASMKALGQLAPVGLTDSMDLTSGYDVLWGFRRIAAARMLGWRSITAYLVPAMDGTTESLMQAAENMERQNLSPLEEVMAVMQIVADSGSVAQAAALLGRSESWVRDRSYVSRLCRPVREMLHAGRFTLGHARVLAEIGDEERQIYYAEMCGGSDQKPAGGVNIMPIAKLKSLIVGQRKSLKIVPWQLEVPFAGQPACIGCPSNTSSDPVLFDDGENSGNRCTNESCFKAKTDLAQKQLDELRADARRGVAKAIAKAEKKSLPETERRNLIYAAADASFAHAQASAAQLKAAIIQRTIASEKSAAVPDDAKPKKADKSAYDSAQNKALRDARCRFSDSVVAAALAQFQNRFKFAAWAVANLLAGWDDPLAHWENVTDGQTLSEFLGSLRAAGHDDVRIDTGGKSLVDYAKRLGMEVPASLELESL